MKTVTEFPEGKARGKYHSKWSALYAAVRRGEIVMLEEADLQGGQPQNVAASIRSTAKRNHNLNLETTVQAGCVYVRMRPQ